LMYEKHNMIFLALRHLTVCIKTFFFFFQIVFCILEVLMKTGYFNTGFVFLRHKIQTDIKKKAYRKRWKSHKILKICFLNRAGFAQFYGLGRTRPKWMGWAQPNKKRNCGSLFAVHMQREHRGGGDWRRKVMVGATNRTSTSCSRC